MFRHYKKLFLAFVALFSVFVLASCSQDQGTSQNAAQTEAPKVETIDGDWELVDTVDALSDSSEPIPSMQSTLHTYLTLLKTSKWI